MFRYLLPIFILLPLVEIWLLITVGQQIGPLATVVAVVATAIIGIYWLKFQGFSTLLRFQDRLLHRELPTAEIIEGVLLVIAGAFLLTPGFATDSVGFALLISPLRQQLAVLGSERIGRSRRWQRYDAEQPEQGTHSAGGSTQERRQSSPQDPIVIEGEFSRESD